MSAQFDAFWAAYPRREGKANCQKLWQQKKLDDLSLVIVAHLKKRVQDDQKWKDGYIKMPLTWLRGECWTDEYQTVKPKWTPGKSVEDSLPRIPDPQQCPYKVMLNLRLLGYLLQRKGVDTDKLRNAVRVRNEIAGEMKLMWGDKANNEELKDLSDGYLRKLKAALV
ncbi:MAG: hypothetical protein E4G90_10545 [Gemmatimonadales bacterium]|nr:MAG: hypothetical protein E4G90_10545 [Gemmatimonadales bacterium]